MNPKTTIALLVVLAACVVYLVVAHTDLFAPGEEDKDLVGAEPADVRELAVSWPGGEEHLFVQEDDKWKTKKPSEGPASKSQLEGIVEQAAGLEYDRAYEPDDDLLPSQELLGLDPARWTVRLTDEDGDAQSISLGNPAPLTKSGVYVRREGDERVFVVSTGLPAALARLVGRDEKDQVRRVAVTTAGGERRTFEREDDDWQLREPAQANADDSEVERIVDELRSMTSETAYEPDDEKAPGPELTGLEAPRWTVEYTDESGSRRVVRIGLPVALEQDKVYARVDGEPRLFVVPTDLPSLLDQPLADFRDKNILPVDAGQIRRIALESDRTYELRKDDEGTWVLVQPIDSRADQRAAKDLAGNLADLTVESFLADSAENLASYRLDQPALTVRITARQEQAGGEEPTTQEAETEKTYELSFSRPSPRDGSVNGKITGQPAIFRFKESVLEDLRPDLAKLRDRKVLRFATGDVKRVEVARADAPDVELSLREAAKEDQEPTWRMEQPFDAEAKRSAVQDLLEKLAELEADDFHDEFGGLELFGLADPHGEVRLRLTGRSKAIRLQIGAETPSGAAVYAKEVTSGSVAAVPAEDVKSLLAGPEAYWPTELLSVSSANIRRIELKRPDGQYALERKLGETRWRMTRPVEAPCDSENVQALVDELAEIDAEQIVALGHTAPEKYALADNAVSVSFQVVKKKVRMDRRGETRPAETQPATATTQPAATQPVIETEKKTHALRVCRIDDEAFAYLQGEDIIAVGRFPASLHETVTAELRDRTVLELKPEQVNLLRLARRDGTLEFRRQDEAWKYLADPAVKIDTSEVEDYLDELAEVKAREFVTYESAKPEAYGLDEPELLLTFGTEAGKSGWLRISAKGPEDGQHRFASSSEVAGVFVLPRDVLDKADKSLGDFKAD